MNSKLTILPVDRKVAEAAAQISLYLRRKNAYLPDADVLIGATALIHKLTLVTGNQRHYGRIPGLKMDDWRMGE